MGRSLERDRRGELEGFVVGQAELALHGIGELEYELDLVFGGHS